MTTADFFGAQRRASRTTRFLVGWLALATVAIVLSVYFPVAFALGATRTGSHLWNPPLFLGIAGLTTMVVAGGAAWKTASLRAGGAAVAEMLGGQPVSPTTQDPAERVLLNVVEEMSIASGVPMPRVYVLSEEAAVNAFAAGWTGADAAVAVTRGCLEQLSRDELQGVIAHEFSHVFHGDMRLNIRMMGLLFGILCIATIGKLILRALGQGFRARRKGGGDGALLLVGVLLVAIGWIGVLFGRLLQAAVSRQREFLADASAVQYTRNPHGIGMALARIGGIGGRLQTPHAEEASHMLFAAGVAHWFGGLFATHPPLEQRIERMLPGFLARYRREHDAVAAAQSTPAPAGTGAAPAAAAGFAPAAMVAHVGDPQPEHFAHARALLRDLPLEVQAAVREPARVGALLLALLYEHDTDRRQRQAALVVAADGATAHDAALLGDAVRALPTTTRLPLLGLCMPALRALPAAQRLRLRELARAVAAADGETTPFDLALLRTLEQHVPLPGEPPRRPTTRPVALFARRPQVAVVLSVLARAGATDDAAAGRSFAAALESLPGMSDLALLPAADCGPDRLRAALDELVDVSPFGKQNLLAAAAAAAANDGVVTPGEGELLRAFAAQWDCPLPPMVATAGTS